MTPPKSPKKKRLVKIAKNDEPWISPEIATEVLKRAKDGSEAIPWETVKAELAEIDRLGL